MPSQIHSEFELDDQDLLFQSSTFVDELLSFAVPSEHLTKYTYSSGFSMEPLTLYYQLLHIYVCTNTQLSVNSKIDPFSHLYCHMILFLFTKENSSICGMFLLLGTTSYLSLLYELLLELELIGGDVCDCIDVILYSLILFAFLYCIIHVDFFGF